VKIDFDELPLLAHRLVDHDLGGKPFSFTEHRVTSIGSMPDGTWQIVSEATVNGHLYQFEFREQKNAPVRVSFLKPFRRGQAVLLVNTAGGRTTYQVAYAV
jgi:hypothetical protein